MRTELVGYHLSRGTNQLGTNCGGPNVSQPNLFTFQISILMVSALKNSVGNGISCEVLLTNIYLYLEFLQIIESR